ncbi:uncharacterized protein EAE98_001928 [Botrytis deweyae]|uniref:Uncharacterized protein n=1 Tax=Botrytis deweyae TaxID=2478750 RepID=A0ABQ7IZ88_9HELO|nr:uncharacterized protein EAE98_001928 [Botrytis deweyae]KAF7937614.1 hypothetical protein EAE98_001928 [Botrytis deweyae]
MYDTGNCKSWIGSDAEIRADLAPVARASMSDSQIAHSNKGAETLEFLTSIVDYRWRTQNTVLRASCTTSSWNLHKEFSCHLPNKTSARQRQTDRTDREIMLRLSNYKKWSNQVTEIVQSTITKLQLDYGIRQIQYKEPKDRSMELKMNDWQCNLPNIKD